MARAKNPRRASRRRRTGCQNCRKRRIKCDEQVPCNYCSRKGWTCTPTDFIVPERWSKSLPAVNCADNRDEEHVEQSNHAPESTYDVFQQVHFTIQSPASYELEPSRILDEILTEKTSELLKVYQTGIGTWMDIFDHTNTYQSEVVRCSLSSPLLMHAICAMSAKQMSLTQNKFLWEPIASSFYGESLSLLIKELTDPSTDRGLLLAATISLGSYELLAEPGADYQRHIYGACTLIQSFKTEERGSRLEQASFWIYARQDVALALVNERPTLTPPGNWPPPPKHADSIDEVFGNKILHLLARIIQIKFTQTESPHDEREGLEPLLSEAESLWVNLPSHVRGVHIKTAVDDHDGLSRIWFCNPAAGAACLYYHMAKILIFECFLEENDVKKYGELIKFHAHEIASICLLSDLPDSAMVVAVNPVFYAAKHLSSMALKTRLWGILDRIETKQGFYTRDRQNQLYYELKI